MTVYSWNMLFRNRSLTRAIEFIERTEFDIFCLQEVPELFLEHLRTLPFSIVAAPDTDRRVRGAKATEYVVIVSRYPIVSSALIPLPYWNPHLPLRGKLFAKLMYWLQLWAEGLGNRHALYADIAVPGLPLPLRVFNLHLTLANPAWRIEEFEQALARRNSAQPSIICGDFNLTESPFVSPLNWILGGTVGDALLYRRERARLEERLAAQKFLNPLLGARTHAFARSQLDHILVSPHFKVRSAEVLSNRLGSDHHPICLSLDHI